MTELTIAEFLDTADHTLLDPATSTAALHEFLANAQRLGVRRVCVSPVLLPIDPAALGALEVVTVVGFPSGAHASSVKAEETRVAVAAGAHEIDMVVHQGAVAAGDWAAVRADIAAVRAACPNQILKVILESAALNDEQIVAACEAAVQAGADFVKTSTGFHASGGASVHAVQLMSHTVGDRAGVKASGGVRTAAAVQALAAAGATRFGVSGTESILRGWDGDAGVATAPQHTNGASAQSY